MTSALRRSISLKHLRLVAVLGRELNLSRTAELLHTTQPALSRSLAQLEGLLETRLFDRTTKRVSLTAAGASLLQHADRILADKGVTIVPDVLANAGGVTCSYLEQCQNFAHLSWDEDEVNARVIDLMRAAFDRFHGFATSSGLPLRKAATVLGVKTIADAHRLRGLHP